MLVLLSISDQICYIKILFHQFNTLKINKEIFFYPSSLDVEETNQSKTSNTTPSLDYREVLYLIKFAFRVEHSSITDWEPLKQFCFCLRKVRNKYFTSIKSGLFTISI